MQEFMPASSLTFILKFKPKQSRPFLAGKEHMLLFSTYKGNKMQAFSLKILDLGWKGREVNTEGGAWNH